MVGLNAAVARNNSPEKTVIYLQRDHPPETEWRADRAPQAKCREDTISTPGRTFLNCISNKVLKDQRVKEFLKFWQKFYTFFKTLSPY